MQQTQARGAAVGIAAELAAASPGGVLLAVGGDGTAHEVANGILRAGLRQGGPALAILPAGSGNDLARQLGFSRDPRRLAARLSAGHSSMIDAGLISWPGGWEWFVNVASFGFTGATARITDRMGKRFGGLSYVVGALRAIGAHRDLDLRLGVDGGPVMPLRICAGVLANAAWFGSGMHVAPGARLDDGRLDLLTVAGAGRARLVGLLAGVFGGWHLRSRTVNRQLVQSIRVEWDGDLPWETDGELLPARSPLTAELHPGVLKVLAGGGLPR